KCRFQKFSDVLAESAHPVDMQGSEIVPESDSGQPLTSFLDHDGFSLIPAASTSAPLLERIKNGYSFLCVVRKTAEELFIPSDFVPNREDIESKKMHFFPITYPLIMPIGKIIISSLFDFGNATFEDFRSLSIDEKTAVASGSFKFLVLLDAAYRSSHYFPDCDTRLAGYLFSETDADLENFLDTVPSKINKDEVSSVYRQNTTKLLKVKDHFTRVSPSDYEFALLLGLTFWNNEISTVCESLSPLVERNRKAIMDDLHSFYKHQARLNYAARVGELFCLLANMEEISTLTDTDMELYKLMNLFTEFGQN
ncbi:hypothetical protein PENTCL1PPCAC_10249, partial [Pristionchus entomophagus]